MSSNPPPPSKNVDLVPDRIVVDPRIYDISRKISIRGVMDALVELITNSFDAYRVAEKSDGVVYVRTYPEKREIVVVDTASGVSGEDFRSKILTAGSLTAGISCRGLMGRGLKDISAIGSLTIRTVKDSRYSRASIGSDLSITDVIISSTPPPDLAEKLQIPGNAPNFFHVCFRVDKLVKWVPDDVLRQRLTDIVFLRNEKTSKISFNGELIKFTLPGEAEKKLLSSFTLKFPGYEEFEKDPSAPSTKLSIYKHSKNLVAECKSAHPDLINDRKDYFYHGIEISSCSTTYEITDCSDGTWNANGYSSFKFINGKLQVPIIHRLARDLFVSGATEKNPFLIFDPNRREGLNRRHPFVKLLFTEVGKWVRHVLKSMTKASDDDAIEESDFLKNVLDTLTHSIQDSLELTDLKIYTWQSKRVHADLKNLQNFIESIEYLDDTIKDDDSNSILPPPERPPAVMQESTVTAKPQIGFQLVTDPDLDYVYRIKYEGEHITVYLNSLDPALSTYITFENRETGGEVTPLQIVEAAASEDGAIRAKATIKPTEPAYVAMGMVVREAITEIQTRNILLTGKKNTTTDDLNSISEIRKEAYDIFKPQISNLFRMISAPKTAPPPSSS